MAPAPTELTRRYLVQHAEHTLFSPYHQWQAWMWQQVVLLDVAGTWQAEDYPHYLKEFWDIFCERRNTWNPVYFVTDTGRLAVQDEGFRAYMKRRWLHLLDREDLVVCFVEPNEMKRTIWKAVLYLIAANDPIRTFADHEQALSWVQGSLCSNSATKDKGGR